MNCSNCNREMKAGEREYCRKTFTRECADCTFHAMNGTRTIAKYNAWLLYRSSGYVRARNHQKEKGGAA